MLSSYTNFNFNTTAFGWDGDGTISSPYRLKYGGVNDSVIGNSALYSAQSITVWFKDSSSSGQRHIVHNDGYSDFGKNGDLYVVDGVLRSRGSSSIVTTVMSVNTWHHPVMTLGSKNRTTILRCNFCRW